MESTVKKAEHRVLDVTEESVRRCCESLMTPSAPKAREQAAIDLGKMSLIIKERKLCAALIVVTLVEVINKDLLNRDRINFLRDAFGLQKFFPEIRISDSIWSRFFVSSEFSTDMAMAYLRFVDSDDAQFDNFSKQRSHFAQGTYDDIESPVKLSKEVLRCSFTFTDVPESLPGFLRDERFERRHHDFLMGLKNTAKRNYIASRCTLISLVSKIKTSLLKNCFIESDISPDLIRPVSLNGQFRQLISHQFPNLKQASDIAHEIGGCVKTALGFEDIAPCVDVHEKILADSSKVFLIMIDLERLLKLWIECENGPLAVFVPPVPF